MICPFPSDTLTLAPTGTGLPLDHLTWSGMTTVAMAGCEGLSASLPEVTNAVGDDLETWERWVDVILQTAGEPAVADMAEHILLVGRTEEP